MTMVDVIIVSYASDPDTIAATQSLLTDPLIRAIWIIDNSTTGELRELSLASPLVQLLEFEDNLGFGGGANMAIARSDAPYLLILNPDVQFGTDTLGRLLSDLQGDDRAVAAAPRLELPDGRTQSTCRKLPSVSLEILNALGIPDRRVGPIGPYILTPTGAATMGYVEQVAGAALLVNGNLLRHLDGFDPTFRLYYEDVDLCRRLLDHGGILFVSEAKALHAGEGTAKRHRRRTTTAIELSRLTYFRKHHSVPAFAAIWGITLFRCTSRATWHGLRSVKEPCGPSRQKALGYLTALRYLVSGYRKFDPLSVSRRARG